MPYITQQERDRLDPLLQPLLYQLGTADRGVFGRLNYVITRLIAYAWRVESSYVRAAALSGVLTNVAAEFYRRSVAPYEDTKIEENGDVEEYK